MDESGAVSYACGARHTINTHVLRLCVLSVREEDTWYYPKISSQSQSSVTAKNHRHFTFCNISCIYEYVHDCCTSCTTAVDY